MIRVTPEDKELIAGIVAREKAIFGRGALNEWHMPFICRYGLVLALVNGGEVVAAAEFMRSWDEPAAAYLVGLWVSEEERGRGRGRALLDGAVRTLAADGLRKLTLTCATDNREGVKLYEACGFRRVAVLSDEYGPGEDRLLYEMALATAQERAAAR